MLFMQLNFLSFSYERFWLKTIGKAQPRQIKMQRIPTLCRKGSPPSEPFQTSQESPCASHYRLTSTLRFVAPKARPEVESCRQCLGRSLTQLQVFSRSLVSYRRQPSRRSCHSVLLHLDKLLTFTQIAACSRLGFNIRRISGFQHGEPGKSRCLLY